MAEVTVSVNNRAFEIICPDGEEGRVRQLADDLARRVAEMKRAAPDAHDTQLYVLAGLAMSDELRQLQDEIDAARRDAAQHDRAETEGQAVALQEQMAKIEDSVADAVDAASERLEGMVETLGKPAVQQNAPVPENPDETID